MNNYLQNKYKKFLSIKNDTSFLLIYISYFMLNFLVWLNKSMNIKMSLCLIIFNESSDLVPIDADPSLTAFNRRSFRRFKQRLHLFFQCVNYILWLYLYFHFRFNEGNIYVVNCSFFLLERVLDILNILIVDIHDSLKLCTCCLVDNIIVGLTNVLFHWLESIRVVS